MLCIADFVLAVILLLQDRKSVAFFSFHKEKAYPNDGKYVFWALEFLRRFILHV